METDNPYKDKNSDLQAAIEMDKIAKTLFAPVYPLIAEQVTQKYKITSGCCIDIGSGPAALSIAMARITDLKIHALDPSPHALDFARKNIKEQGFSDRITPAVGRVEKMPFEDNFADLIVSRGSIFFWENLVPAFNQIYRVLKPGGHTHIGGGFGNGQLKAAIFKEMAKKGDRFQKKAKNRFSPENIKRITHAIEQSDVRIYDIDQSDKGLWFHITKEIE